MIWTQTIQLDKVNKLFRRSL